MDEYPDYTMNERIADSVIHVIGIAFAISALSVMMTFSGLQQPYYATITLAIYGVAMVLMFTCSAAYHMVPMPNWKQWLRRFDHAAIFLKIAATYTPFAFLKLGGYLGYGLLSTVWIVAIIGMGIVLSMHRGRSHYIVFLYLALGWVGVIIIWPLAMSMSTLAFSLICVGGALYSIGTIFHVWESLRYSNAIWHLFVLLATMCHFFAVFVAVIVDGI